MKINLGILVFLLLQFKGAMPDLERELRTSIDKAMQCDRRDPPKEPVIAMSPKRFTQLVGLLKNDLAPSPCDKGRYYPPFRLEDPSGWSFCVFGTCRNDKCDCFKSYSGPSCAVHSSNCWLMYCFLTSCHAKRQSFNCKCDTKLYGKKVTTDEYWYDEGKQHRFIPPPIGWSGVSHGQTSAAAPLMKGPDIWVPLGKTQQGELRASDSRQRQEVQPQHRQIPGHNPYYNPNLAQLTFVDEEFNPPQSQQHHPHGGQMQGQVGNTFQSQQNQNSGQIQGGVNKAGTGNSFQSQQHLPNSRQNSNLNFNKGAGSSQEAGRNKERQGSSLKGSQGSKGNDPGDATDDIEEALEEITEEPASAMSLFGKEYILCSVVIILHYVYQYYLNI